MIDTLEWVAAAITGHPVFALVLAYSVFPYAVLWVAVRCWPKGDPRRAQYLADYEDVPWLKRPLFVGDVAIRSLLDGLEIRNRNRRDSQARRLAAVKPARTEPSSIWFVRPRLMLPFPLCTYVGLPGAWAAYRLGAPAWAGLAVALITGAATIHGLHWLIYMRRRRRWRRANERLESMDPVSS